MRSASIALLAACALFALSLAAAAGAVRPGPVEDGTLSVRDGRAMIQLRIKGGVIGRFARGKLTVTESVAGTATMVVRGAKGMKVRHLNDRTTVYTGTNIRFRIADGVRFVVKINASKINFSAVGRGNAWLDGWGDPSRGVYFDGSYSLNGGDYRSLPDVRERFELAAPPTGIG
jgi:hypothetical protein